jgi:RHS repeat-associated protein
MDTNGELLSQNRYLPFGEIRDDIASSPITQTDFGYTGQRNLADIGLMDYNARFYSPTLMRFIQPDSIVPDIGNPQAWNRYSYVYNSPIVYFDPSGHLGVNRDLCHGSDGYGQNCGERLMDGIWSGNEIEEDYNLYFVTGIVGVESHTDVRNQRRDSKWNEEDLSLLRDLKSLGFSESDWAYDYILENGIDLSIVDLNGAGAAWFNFDHIFESLFGNTIWIDRHSLESNRDWSLVGIVEETFHKSQGAGVATSVYGEWQAWNFASSLWSKMGHELNEERKWLLKNEPNFNRADLKTARSKMITGSPEGYRIDLLPLRPLIP